MEKCHVRQEMSMNEMNENMNPYSIQNGLVGEYGSDQAS